MDEDHIRTQAALLRQALPGQWQRKDASGNGRKVEDAFWHDGHRITNTDEIERLDRKHASEVYEGWTKRYATEEDVQNSKLLSGWEEKVDVHTLTSTSLDAVCWVGLTTRM